MKLRIIKFDGEMIEMECDDFEFRTNQVANWITITQGNTKITIHGIAVIETFAN